MKIAGFEIGKKKLVIIGGIVGVIAIVSVVSSSKQRAEDEERIKSEQERLEAVNNADSVNNTVLSYEDQMQQSLVEQYGEPPDGFKWDVMGNLVALSSDDMSAEDVVHTFLRAVSILDFATAQRYSSSSKIYDTYTGYFDEISTAITDYYDQFLRKQYTFALKSIENNGVEGVATLADGTQVISVKLSVLDLTDKDFWREDTDELYNQMRVFAETEEDDTKKEQYLYEYIYNAYETGVIGKRDVIIDFKIAKQNGGGWLLADDNELNAYLMYENGTDIVSYIENSYDTWYRETVLNEQQDELERQQEEIERQLEVQREDSGQTKED